MNGPQNLRMQVEDFIPQNIFCWYTTQELLQIMNQWLHEYMKILSW